MTKKTVSFTRRWQLPLAWALQKPLPSTSPLCLSRACLGKYPVCSTKWRQIKRTFSAPATLSFIQSGSSSAAGIGPLQRCKCDTPSSFSIVFLKFVPSLSCHGKTTNCIRSLEEKGVTLDFFSPASRARPASHLRFQPKKKRKSDGAHPPFNYPQPVLVKFAPFAQTN
jgi:hypothetical protein